jgi:hypothetical protein
MLKRTLTRAWRREELWNGNRESYRLIFTSKDSLLLWGIHHHRAHFRNGQRDLDEVPHTAPLVELRNDPEVDAFVASLAKDATKSALRGA